MGPDGVMITPQSSTPSSPIVKKLIIHSTIDDPMLIKPWFCKKCLKRYKNSNGLKYHVRVEHQSLEFEKLKGYSG